MPLKKGTIKKAFDKNVKISKSEGKPIKQAVAIAHSMKRKGY
jgi:hypothetical protein